MLEMQKKSKREGWFGEHMGTRIDNYMDTKSFNFYNCISLKCYNRPREYLS